MLRFFMDVVPFPVDDINRDLLAAAGGIYPGKRQELDHAKALWRSVMSGQRW